MRCARSVVLSRGGKRYFQAASLSSRLAWALPVLAIVAFAGGMLRWDEAEIAHQLACRGKAVDVADPRDQSDG